VSGQQPSQSLAWAVFCRRGRGAISGGGLSQTGRDQRLGEETMARGGATVEGRGVGVGGMTPRTRRGFSASGDISPSFIQPPRAYKPPSPSKFRKQEKL